MADEKWDPAFWAGKRVFVTGHTGFIGSWLSLWLTRLGAQVTGYALAPHTRPNLYDTLALDGALTSHLNDICDRAALATALDTAQPEIVIHLAAQAIVGQAHADAYETWRVNTLGTVALLEAMRGREGVKALTLFTTDKVYDNAETGHAHRETDSIGGLGLYDSSKGAAELAIRAFLHGNAIPAPTLILRAGNVIGGGDWSEARLVPDCARAFAMKQPVGLRHPSSIRPWQHVLDVCYATLLLSEKLHGAPNRFAGAWNIGPDASGAASTSHIAEQLAAHWQQQPAWQQVGRTSDFPEAATLLLDSSKLASALGWKPVLSLAEALAMSADWYRAWEATPGAIAATCTAQIDAFTARLARNA